MHSTIILDLEAELDQMNQNRDIKNQTRLANNTPIIASIPTQNGEIDSAKPRMKYPDQVANIMTRNFNSQDPQKQTLNNKTHRLDDSDLAGKTNRGSIITNTETNSRSEIVPPILSEVGIKQYKGSIYGIENLDQTATKQEKPTLPSKNEKVWDAIFQKRQNSTYDQVEIQEPDTHENSSNQSSFGFLRGGQHHYYGHDKENYLESAGNSLIQENFEDHQKNGPNNFQVSLHSNEDQLAH